MRLPQAAFVLNALILLPPGNAAGPCGHFHGNVSHLQRDARLQWQQTQPDQPTLASLLKKHGYATDAVIGSAVLDSRFGLNQGYDFCYDHFDFNRPGGANLEEMKPSGDVVRDAALSWLGH
jgi:arylsulfatase A-like enzyme